MERHKYEEHEDDEEDINVENLSPSKQIDRFHKRLEVYRSHQNECKLRVDQTVSELVEHQNNEIAVLKNKCMEVKPKRVNKKASRKPMDLEKDIERHRQFMPVLQSGNSSKFSVTIVHKLEFSASMNQQQQQQQQQHHFNAINNIQVKRENCQPQISLPPPSPLQQPSQQQFINPENEFDDLDFNDIANFLGQINQPIELLNFDENLQQQISFNGPSSSSTFTSSSSSLYQHQQQQQPADDRQFYNAYRGGFYFNPNFLP